MDEAAARKCFCMQLMMQGSESLSAAKAKTSEQHPTSTPLSMLP